MTNKVCVPPDGSAWPSALKGHWKLTEQILDEAFRRLGSPLYLARTAIEDKINAIVEAEVSRESRDEIEKFREDLTSIENALESLHRDICMLLAPFMCSAAYIDFFKPNEILEPLLQKAFGMARITSVQDADRLVAESFGEGVMNGIRTTLGFPENWHTQAWASNRRKESEK